MTIGRNSKIDFLRAISMLLIVVQHYVVWGVKKSPHEVFKVDSIYTLLDYTSMEALYLLSCVGVNCFIMITGYFLINREAFRWTGLVKLWITTLIYSVGLYVLVSFLSGGGNLNWGTLLECCLPIWSDQYWFITKYFGLMLIAPFLSSIASRLDKQSYLIFLVIMFCMGFMIPYGRIFAGGMSLFWMTFVFLTGGYVRLYSMPNILTNHTIFLFCALLCVYTFAVLGMEVVKNTDFSGMSGLYKLHSFASDSPIFFLSLVLFIWASKESSVGRIFIYKVCVRIAPYILAVYLIHMNRFFYPFIWDIIIPDNYCLPVALHALITCTCIFLLCIGIDYMRDLCFKLLGINKLIETFTSRIKFKKVNYKKNEERI